MDLVVSASSSFMQIWQTHELCFQVYSEHSHLRHSQAIAASLLRLGAEHNKPPTSVSEAGSKSPLDQDLH